MQLKSKELKQLYRIVSLVLREAQWDYSALSMSVVKVNEDSLVFDLEQINILSEIKQQLEREMKYE